MNMEEHTIPAFNFLQEISKGETYHMLFPKPLVGLAIMELYTKHKEGVFPNGRFKEVEIYHALENANTRIKDKYFQRKLKEYFNSIIGDLQTYFLRYNSDDQLYSLKNYAILFCEYAEKALEESFNPTQIEIICNTIRENLEKCETPRDVDEWISLWFNTFKPKMKAQVDNLDRQIDRSVGEIRNATQLTDTSIIDILKSIDRKLDNIRSQNEELRSAFREMKSIDALLAIHLNETIDPVIGDHISEARHFFPEIKYTLNLIDKRLDRIQPKLRQFFGTLNQTSFNLKVDKFLKFLITQSTLTGSKQIQFPNNIVTYALWQPITNFTIVERRNELFPAKAGQRSPMYELPEEREAELLKMKNTLVLHSQIDKWITRILGDAKQSRIKFSDYFFSIVDSHNGDIELATKIAYALVKLSTTDKHLQVEIDQEKIFHHKYSSLAIWEMTLIYHQ